MIWWPYFTLWSKRSLSRCGLLDHILYEWRLVRRYFEWVWVILGRRGIISGKWGWVEVYGPLFWMDGGEWSWVGHYFGWLGVSGKIFWVGGGGWGWVGMSALFDNTRLQHVKKLKKLVQEFHIRFSCSLFLRCSS